MAALSPSAQRLRERFLVSWEPLENAPPFPTEAEHQQVLRFLTPRRQGDARSCADGLADK